jgi:hypothetical protein
VAPPAETGDSLEVGPEDDRVFIADDVGDEIVEGALGVDRFSFG